jgi:hypothetical protein
MMRTCDVSGPKSTVGRWVGCFGFTILQVFLCAALRGATAPTQTAMLGWNASADPSTAGYYVYYGTASGQYSTKLDAGTNCAATVTNLPGGATYYFAATAYNSADVESPVSNEATFLATTNQQPILNSVNVLFVNVLSNLVVTNTASEPNSVGRRFTYSLDAGAPQGMHINRNTGVLRWAPPLWAGGNSYVATVHVVDNATPPASSAANLTVQVGNGVVVSFSQAVAAAGQTGSATMNLFSSAMITNLSFTLGAPSGLVNNVTLTSLMPGVVAVKQSPVGAVQSTVTLTTTNGAALVGSNAVVQVNFTVAAGLTSSFQSLLSTSVASQQTDGTAVPTAIGTSGELVLVGRQSLVEGRVLANGEQDLYLYGPLTSNYVVQSTSTPANSNSWKTAFSGTFTNLTQPFKTVNSTNMMIFFRAYTH